MLKEEIFTDAVRRERKRANRFEEAFVMVLVSLDSSTSKWRWDQVVRALSKALTPVDLLGWFEHGTVLGLLRPLAGCGRTESAAAAAAMPQELMRCLAAARAESCSIRWEVHVPQQDARPPDAHQVPGHQRAPRAIARDLVKRLLDVAGSASLLVALLPVFLAVAVLISFSSKGPVLFRQQRVGRNGEPFEMLKFRTMEVDADTSIHQQYVAQVIDSQRRPNLEKNEVCKLVNDPRVTPLGRLLRRSSLDELPQFWNVLRGDMSLVGPRPPLPYEVARYKPWHRRRVLEAKPGITGLWQVTGRSRTTFDDMVRLDLRYAQTYSLWTDVKILLATPRAVISGNGAH